jgi:phage-related minor tail protein
VSTIADLVIRIAADADDVESGVSKAGSMLTKTLTPAAAAIGAAGALAFKEYDAGFDAIRAGTGATGADLDALGGVMQDVAGRVTAPLSEVGQTVADLNTRLGLTGEPLATMTQRISELTRRLRSTRSSARRRRPAPAWTSSRP